MKQIGIRQVRPQSSSIAGVSDTALWIAAVRANEGARRDAVFHDPLASILAGERGRRIARSIPRRSMVAWGVVARTSAIDRLIEEAVGAGVDTVINLGAGLDTRPYRMKVPAELRWIEVDFPQLTEFKADKLKDYRAACRLERIGLDLLDRAARTTVLTRAGQSSRSALIITEGVVSYLSNADVSRLAEDLFAISSFRFWIQDFDNAGKRKMPRGWDSKLKAAPFLFEPSDWFDFFRQYGWAPSRIITNIEESGRIKRPYPWDFPYGLIMRVLPSDVRHRILSLSGAALWQKS
jgi:methyltransferase (TIGR00027 family)